MKFKTQVFHIKKLFSTKTQIKPKICVVGAGPAGFYAAQHLVKKLNTPEIDIYEKLPVPFGLVRYGVAPDHPEVKNVVHTFTKTAENPNIKFFGNINLGTDISLDQLRKAYHVVLLTYGAEESKKLNILGNNLGNCIEARKIVGWYNGVPWDSNLDIDLTGESAAIFGQGNVAIDVARILLTPVDELKKTDITEHALQVLSTSNLSRVYLIGRRGPLQAAFTIKELREMLKLRNCRTMWREDDFIGISDCVSKLARPKKRLTELMLKSLREKVEENCSNEFKPIFYRSPLEIFGEKKTEGAILGANILEGDNFLTQRAVLTEEKETIKCNLVIPSIGYKSVQADATIPFDFSQGLVKNDNFKVDKGLYVSGWLGTGPIGVIVTTMTNAFECAEIISRDIQLENLIFEEKGGSKLILTYLEQNNVQVVDWEGWKKIDEHEQKRGAELGKPREKIVNVGEMLQIAT